MNDYIWYASYGSNMNYERFLLYIKGGLHESSGRNYIGSMDKSLPVKDQLLIIPHELYFSGKSRSWSHRSVAFIKPLRDDSESTISRCYLVSRIQFTDILLQENDIMQNSSNIIIDISGAVRTGWQDLTCSVDSGSYNKVLYLGDIDRIPVMTFTSTISDSRITFGKPDILYLKTMFHGIRQFSDLKKDEIIDYLILKNGVHEEYDRNYLMSIID